MKKLIAVLFSAFAASAFAGGTYYADASVEVSGDGLTPETAKKTIQEAVNLCATSGDTVKVAEGVYQDTNTCTYDSARAVVVHCSISGLEENESAKFRDVRVVNARPQTVRLVSYNVRHGEGADGKVDLGRTAAALNAAKPDFVALQELDDGRKRSGGVDQMKELGRLTGMWPAFGKALVTEGDGTYGVGLLTRREPKSVRTVALPGAPDMEPRALLIAEFDDICFASTHLANGKDKAEWRIKSAEVIAAEAAKCGKPFIVCGDWNDEAESPTLAKMREGFQLLSQTDAPTFFGYKPGTTARCIDYIAVDAAHAASVKIATPSRVVRAEGVSDHALLTVDVLLNQGVR